ncbi:hypothetical protein FKM82_017513 [Ascaphus truei]
MAVSHFSASYPALCVLYLYVTINQRKTRRQSTNRRDSHSVNLQFCRIPQGDAAVRNWIRAYKAEFGINTMRLFFLIYFSSFTKIQIICTCLRHMVH